MVNTASLRQGSHMDKCHRDIKDMGVVRDSCRAAYTKFTVGLDVDISKLRILNMSAVLRGIVHDPRVFRVCRPLHLMANPDNPDPLASQPLSCKKACLDIGIMEIIVRERVTD